MFEEKLERREQLVCDGFDLEVIVLSSVKALISYFRNSELGVNQKELGKLLRISGQAVGKKVRLGEKIAREEGIDILNL